MSLSEEEAYYAEEIGKLPKRFCVIVALWICSASLCILILLAIFWVFGLFFHEISPWHDQEKETEHAITQYVTWGMLWVLSIGFLMCVAFVLIAAAILGVSEEYNRWKKKEIDRILKDNA